MKESPESNVWSIEVLFEETPDETQAEAVLELRGERHAGWGRARRNPTDPNVPQIGEELACARALSDLAHNLFVAATTEIERREGRTPEVHL
jgi:hypothetical protein